jgi:hypothetical protein
MTQVTGAQRFLSKGAFRSRGRRSPAARLEIRLVDHLLIAHWQILFPDQATRLVWAFRSTSATSGMS